MLSKSEKKRIRPALALFLLALLMIGLTIPAFAAGSTEAITVDMNGTPELNSAGLTVSYEWTDGNASQATSKYGSSATVVAEAVDGTNNIACSASGFFGNTSTKGSTTLTVTLTNSSEQAKTLTFTLTKGTVCNEVTVSGAELVSGSTYSAVLDNGGSCVITLVTTVPTANTGETNSVTLTDVKMTGEGEVVVTFANPEDGSGTTTLNNMSAVYTAENITECNGIALNATAAQGYTFIGWKSKDTGALLSSSVSSFPRPDVSMTVYPYFVPSDSPIFKVGSNQYYYWQEAFADAAASGNMVILAKNGTLLNDKTKNVPGTYVTADASGNVTYTIPSGVKFLIPFSSTDDGSFTSGESLTDIGTTATTYTTNSKLTVASGAKIVCNGQMNVNGQRDETGQTDTGGPAGNHGLLKLEGTADQTQLTVNGTLYCYGFITGKSKVEVNGTIHEFMQMCDFCGGTNTTAWNTRAKIEGPETFMVSQYYIQNVEAQLQINSGATARMETAITAGGEPFRASSILIGTDSGLFHLGSGTYMLRTYDASTDRVTYTLGGSGTCTFGQIEVPINVSGAEITLNSKNHVLPINSAMTVKVGNGVTVSISNDFAILPGGQVIIDRGGKVNMSGALYIFDKADWVDEYTFNTGIARAPAYTIGRGTSRKLAISSGGRLEINGTLNLTGALRTTSDNTTLDSNNRAQKMIHGTGTFIHSGAADTKKLYVGYLTDGYRLFGLWIPTGLKNSENTAGSSGYYAGLSGTGSSLTPKTFTSGKTYYGVAANTQGVTANDQTAVGEGQTSYWYQHVIMVANGSAGVVPSNSVGSSTYRNSVPSITTAANNNVVGYAANTGTFSFTVNRDVCAVLIDGSTATAGGGVYTISNITGDHTITLVEHTPGPAATCEDNQTCTNCPAVLQSALGHDEVIDNAVNPTCTKKGKTEGKHCDRCDVVLVAQEDVDMLPHTPVTDERIPNCFQEGLTEGSHCGECGEILVAQEKLEAIGHHTWKTGTCEAGICDVCKAQFKVRFTNIAVTDGLDLYFYIEQAALTGLEKNDFYVKISKDFADDRADNPVIVRIDGESWTSTTTKDGTQLYGFCFSDISAKEMTDEITATVYYEADDAQASIAYTETIEKYALRTLASETYAKAADGTKDAKLRTSLVDMLNYGAACQTQFTYNTGDPANAELTAAQKAWGTPKAADCVSVLNKTEDDCLYGTSVSATNTLVFTFYYDFDAAGIDCSTVNAVFTYEDHHGRTKEIETSDWFRIRSGSKIVYGIDATNISIASGRSVITCTLYKDGAKWFSNMDSVQGYAARAGREPLMTTMEMMMRFVDSASAYFNFGN